MTNFSRLMLCLAVSALISSCKEDKDESFVLPDVPKTGIALPYTVLGTGNGVEIRNGGFGSASCAHPTNAGEFYAMTDRGPNADATGGKFFPTPDYTPRIGHFKLNNDGTLEKLGEILLKDPSGNPISGRPNPAGFGSTGEIPYDLSDNVLTEDQYGLDPEGLVALKDGSFWVSDEYGPHIVHFSATGVQLERISPVGINTGSRKIPAVFAKRWANRGMEGLAITPDEKTLVGIMQSRLYNPSNAAAINKTLTRIVTFDIASGSTKQYLYKQELDNNSNSEICALSATQFLMVERDGLFSGDGPVMKHIYKIDISGASDVSGSDFDAVNGMLVNGKALEANTWDELSAAGITPVSKTLAVDVFSFLGDFPHDKLESIWLINSNTIGIINDDDFGIWSDPANKIKAKTLSPTSGTVRDGNRLYILKY